MSAPAKSPPRTGRALLLVFLGGTVGTGLRALLSWPLSGDFPLGVLIANLSGSLALGLLLGVLSARGPDTGPRRELRLLLGVGLLGGFTTFSALAVDTVQLGSRSPGLGAALVAGTLILGVAAAGFGLSAGARLGRRNGRGTP